MIYPHERNTCCWCASAPAPHPADACVRLFLVALSTGLSPEVEARCSALVNSANIVLFMKGERHAPKCGFSNTSVQVLDACGAAYKVCAGGERGCYVRALHGEAAA